MKFKFLAVLGVIFIVILAGFLFLNKDSLFNRKNAPSIEKISDAPEYFDLTVENMSLEGEDEKFSLRRGEFFRGEVKIDIKAERDLAERILKLALFYQWMREDPLFFSATLETEKFDKALAGLKAKQAEFLKLNGFKTEAFPVNFLEKFSESSNNFKSFSSNITEKNALALLDAVKTANHAYNNDAKNLMGKLQALGLDKRTKLIGLLGDNYTNLEIILRDMDRILENAKVAGEEIEERQKCLNDSPSFCRRLGKEDLNFSGSEKSENKTPVILSEEDLNLKDGNIYYGPYRANSSCWQNVTTQYLYVFKECPKYLSYCFGSPHLATKSYFVRLIPGLPFDDSLIAKGAKVIPQRATNPYTCNDLEYQPKIFTIDYFYKTYKNDLLFEKLKAMEEYVAFNGELKELIGNGLSIERKFFEEKYPSENSLEDLSKIYALAYIKLGEDEIAGGLSIREYFLNRNLVIKERLSNFDLSINYETYFLSGFKLILDVRGGKTSENYFYPIRSNYSLLFLGFSSSVWRSGHAMEFIKPDIRDMDQVAKDLRLIHITMQNSYSSTISPVMDSELSRVNIIDWKTAEYIYEVENLSRWRELFNKHKEKMEVNMEATGNY